MEKILTFDELECITGGADISSGLTDIIAGGSMAGAGVKAVYVAATKATTIFGMSCPPALFVVGGVALIVGGVGLAAYGFSLLDD